MAGPSVNKVILVGNLGGDPELRYTASGKAVATFTVATSTLGGRDREATTEWHRIVVWEKLAEQCSQYLFKGRQVYLEGRLQTRSWDDRQTGQKRFMTEVVANQVIFLGPGQGRQGRGADPLAEGTPPGTQPGGDSLQDHGNVADPGAGAEDVPPSTMDDGDDQIPF